MSLAEKIKERAENFSSGINSASLDEEILKIFKEMGEALKNENNLLEKQSTLVSEFYTNYALLSDQLVAHYGLDLLQISLDICTSNIYKNYFDLDCDIIGIQSKLEKPTNNDELTIFLVSRFFLTLSHKEAHLYMRTANERATKNAQRKLFIIDVYHFLFQNINNKELYYPEMLPDILKNLNYSLRYYFKHRNNVDNNDKGIAEHHLTYVYNYEKWIIHILQKYFSSIKANSESLQSKCRLLLAQDLYDLSVNQKGIKKLQPSNEKILTHYYVLFLFDILEGAAEAITHSQFQKHLVELMIKNILETLKIIHPHFIDYILNFNKQLRLLKFDPPIADENKKDEDHLPFKSYTKFTFYNLTAIAYILLKYLEDNNQTILFTNENKIRTMMPIFYEIMRTGREKEQLKNGLLSLLNTLTNSIKEENQIENLNYFDVPLNDLCREILEYSGNLMGDQERQWAIQIFTKFSNFLKEPVNPILINITLSI